MFIRVKKVKFDKCHAMEKVYGFQLDLIVNCDYIIRELVNVCKKLILNHL